ncbi:UDP-glycosyltransferase 89A2-like [Arachis stenosperma]|uniref:UDP-glycosyltransferase 89A2-like n=1 Tax=Arachis stenosperma TaxID=217475 RepID=UPI0025AB90B7|nr:UDP-glycosyltransferase 89A2-like [Arachis stenosperma]
MINFILHLIGRQTSIQFFTHHKAIKKEKNEDMSCSSVNSNNTHILVFPYPAQGHILALLDLTHNLALRGLSITIIITPNNLPILKPLLTTHPTTIRTLTLPFPSHPTLPARVEHVRDVGNTGNYPFINALSKLQTPIIEWCRTHTNPPVALISDFFLGWTHQLADQLGIKRIAFQSSSALLAIIFHRTWPEAPALRARPMVEFPDLLGAPSFRNEHLPSLLRLYKESESESEFVRESMIANTTKSWGYIFNTSRALEGPYLEHVSKIMGHSRVFGVGPLCLIGVGGGFNRVDRSPNTGSGNVLEWLDGCEEDGSVLYVCFGSQKLLRKELMEALAAGLERSGTRFVWVVKEATTAEHVEKGYGSVPDGFEDRVLGRGLLVRGWAPQVSILGHRAVGGFLSHCGWNSVLEAVAAGVALLGWPMEADQFVNAWWLVEVMGVAVMVSDGADSLFDPDDMGRVIHQSMGADSIQKERSKALREEAIKAVGDSGSSSKELHELVEALKQLKYK